MRSVVILLLVSLLSTSASAGENPYLTAALRLYQDFELEAARAQLEKAQRVSDNTPEQDITIGIYLGLTLMGLNEVQAAEQAFLSALALDPNVELPPESTPATRELFEEIRERVTAAGMPLTPKVAPPPAPPVEPAPAVTEVAAPAGLPMAVPVVTTAVGAGALIAGIALGAVAQDNAQRAPRVYGGQRLAQEAHGQAVGANVLLAVGGVVAAAGGALFLFSGDEPLIPIIAPAGAEAVALGLMGSF